MLAAMIERSSSSSTKGALDEAINARASVGPTFWCSEGCGDIMAPSQESEVRGPTAQPVETANASSSLIVIYMGNRSDITTLDCINCEIYRICPMRVCSGRSTAGAALLNSGNISELRPHARAYVECAEPALHDRRVSAPPDPDGRAPLLFEL